MYCPVCFNSSLLPASNGVIKVTFNGKAKNTSQFFYNTLQETPEEIYDKLKAVVEDYFSWYSEFQNQDVIKNVSFFSADFVCSNKCKLTNEHRVNMVGPFLDVDTVLQIIQVAAKKYSLEIDLTHKSLSHQ